MRPVVTASLLLALVALVSVSVGSGGFVLPWQIDDAWLLETRGLHVLAACLTGMALSLSGVWAQALFRNELVDPFVLGLSGGAAAGAVLSLAFMPWLTPGPGAVLGAVVAALCVRALARDDATLLLTGVGIGAVAASIAGLVLSLHRDAQLLRPATHWLLGGFGEVRFVYLLAGAVVLALALGFTLLSVRDLDTLLLGDELAHALGTEVARVRRRGLLVVVLLTASAVLSGGIIGFVGLVAPHLSRRFVGASHRLLPLVATLSGAAWLMASDAAARAAFAPREVPVGLLTSLCGAPVFLLALRRRPL
jgi:iron complex transport system permease protein